MLSEFTNSGKEAHIELHKFHSMDDVALDTAFYEFNNVCHSHILHAFMTDILSTAQELSFVKQIDVPDMHLLATIGGIGTGNNDFSVIDYTLTIWDADGKTVYYKGETGLTFDEIFAKYNDTLCEVNKGESVK